jgi:hypothetical protein
VREAARRRSGRGHSGSAYELPGSVLTNAGASDAQAEKVLLHLRMWDEGFGRLDVALLH